MTKILAFRCLLETTLFQLEMALFLYQDSHFRFLCYRIIGTIHGAVDRERSYAFFQRDGATMLTSSLSVAYVRDAIGEERTVSKVLWPPRLPDLSS